MFFMLDMTPVTSACGGFITWHMDRSAELNLRADDGMIAWLLFYKVKKHPPPTPKIDSY